MIQNYALKVFSLLTLVLGFSGLVVAQTSTFSYTGAVQTYTVPAGVTSIQIECWGAQGGSGVGFDGVEGTGGLGGYAVGNLTVTPGEVLEIYVGGAGAASGPGGYNGGGQAGTSYGAAGGGASDVRNGSYTLSDRLIVAGGGGGGAFGSYGNNGGDGGGETGGSGVSGGGFTGGGGGTQVSGGTAGCCYGAAAPGTFGLGAGPGDYHNAGGGGGWYGGGSGAGHAGAGGGSSYLGGVTDSSTTAGVNTGNGQIVITVLCNGLTTTVSATEVCFGEEVTLSATSTTGGSVSWDGGITDGVAFTPGLDTTTYTATSDSPSDCSFSVDIVVHALPTVDAGLDTSLCEGAMMMLAGAGNADTYTWTGGVTDSVAFAPTVGTTEYIVTGEDTITGCMNYDTINVTYTEIDETVSVSGITLTSNEVTTGATYQWVDCPSYSIISGETAVSFTPQADGEYAVIVSNNGCVDTSACETIAGVGVEDWNESILVYPNPVQNNLTIAVAGTFNYAIYDINGRIVINGTAVNKEQLNLENLENGVYQIILTNESESSSIKIVKQ